MQLKKILTEIFNLKGLSYLKTLFPNRLWQVKTSDGYFLIKKLIASEAFKWAHFDQGQKIALLFQQQGIPTLSALPQGKTFSIATPYGRYAISPWLKAKVLSKQAASTEYAYKIGQILARLHHTPIMMAEAVSPSTWIYFKEDWAPLIPQIKAKSWASYFLKNLRSIESWSGQYQEGHAQLEPRSKVISHGDLTQANILWRNPQEYCIIDWEAAGYLHPQIELLGVAFNWSGITIQQPKLETFNAVLKGYQQAGGYVCWNTNLLKSCLGSWLSWLYFCTAQALEQPRYIEEVNKTIQALYRLELFSKTLEEQKWSAYAINS